MLERLRDSFWKRNAAFYYMLGLCPLLAVTNSIQNALALAAASSAVLVASSMLVNVLRPLILHHLRLPVFVLSIATFTTAATLCMEALAWTIYVKVALYLQIVVTNCMILGHLERVASKESFSTSVMDAIGTAGGFAAALIVLGGIRQLLEPIFPLAAHPSGAFIIFGLLVALVRYLAGESRETNPDVREVALRRTQPHDGT